MEVALTWLHGEGEELNTEGESSELLTECLPFAAVQGEFQTSLSRCTNKGGCAALVLSQTGTSSQKT